MRGPAIKLPAGFSLLELMVVTALLAILVSLALPSYRKYLERGYRADAIRTLHSIASCQERVRAGSGYYDTSRCLDGIDQQHYGFELQPENEAATLHFTAFATPVGLSDDDPCGTLSIDQAGSTGISRDPGRLAACWGGR